MLGLKLMAVRVWHQNFLPKWMDVFGAKVLRIFKVLFQKHLKAEVPSRQFRLLMTNKKARQRRAFCVCIVSWGFRPKPGPKDFLKKVLWNLKNFRQNKAVYSGGSSFTYFSPKEK